MFKATTNYLHLYCLEYRVIEYSIVYMFIQACMRLGMHRYIEYVQPGQGVAQGVCV